MSSTSLLPGPPQIRTSSHPASTPSPTPTSTTPASWPRPTPPLPAPLTQPATASFKLRDQRLVHSTGELPESFPNVRCLQCPLRPGRDGAAQLSAATRCRQPLPEPPPLLPRPGTHRRWLGRRLAPRGCGGCCCCRCSAKVSPSGCWYSQRPGRSWRRLWMRSKTLFCVQWSFAG